MTEKHEAMEQSIDHWRRLLHIATRAVRVEVETQYEQSYPNKLEERDAILRALVREGWKSDHCELCHKYFFQTPERGTYPRDSCKGCPVSETTGLRGCINTPWKDANHAINCYIDRQSLKAAQIMRSRIADELAFLVTTADALPIDGDDRAWEMDL